MVGVHQAGYKKIGGQTIKTKVMLQKSKAYGGFSVDDIKNAKTFYRDTLGLTVTNGPMGTLELHVEGGRPILVYPKPNLQPATFTILNFPVKDIGETVDSLSKKGIVFEQYRELGTDERGIAHNEGPLIAWFKDPAGNVLFHHPRITGLFGIWANGMTPCTTFGPFRSIFCPADFWVR